MESSGSLAHALSRSALEEELADDLCGIQSADSLQSSTLLMCCGHLTQGHTLLRHLPVSDRA